VTAGEYCGCCWVGW